AIAFGAAQVAREEGPRAVAAAGGADLGSELVPLDAVRRLVGDFDPESNEFAPGPQNVVEVLADLAVHDVLPGLAVLAPGAQSVHAAGDEDAVAVGQRDERRADPGIVGMVLPDMAVERGEQAARRPDAHEAVVPVGQLQDHLGPALPFVDPVLAG